MTAVSIVVRIFFFFVNYFSLCASGCDVNKKDGPEQQPPLLQAAILGDLQVVRLLLAHNAVVDPGPCSL